MPSSTWKITKIILGFLAIPVSLMLVYAMWARWEMRHLEAFCKEIQPGMSVSLLPAIAEKYGFERNWVERSVFDARSNDWFTSVPAASSFGEIGCDIHHNKSVVTSAIIE
jgi:hypothetical protein